MPRGRRWLRSVPQLTRRPFEDVAQQLEEWLKLVFGSESDGIPSGFSDLPAQPVEAGTLGSAGTETAGWAAGDHVHKALTATAHSLDPSSVNSEGTASTLARSDHTHDVSAIVDEAMIFAIIFGGK